MNYANDMTTDKLQKLMTLCAAEILIEINPNRSSYQSVREYFNDNDHLLENGNVTEEKIKDMVQKNVIIRIQAYNRSPVGFYLVFDSDIDSALDRVIEACEE